MKEYYFCERKGWHGPKGNRLDNSEADGGWYASSDVAELRALCDGLAEAHTRMLEGPFLADRDKQICRDAIAKYDQWRKDNEQD